MAVIEPWSMDALVDEGGTYIGGPQYDGATLRAIFSSLLSAGDAPTRARPGVVTGLGVTVVDDTAFVGAGLCVVTTPDGSFVTGLDAEEALTLEARHATNARRDRVVAQIDHTPTERGSRFIVISGIPAPTPQAPPTPAGAESLGTIDVPAAGGPPAVFNDGRRYTASRGGIIAVPNTAALNRTEQGTSTEPAYAAVGENLYVSTGSGWRPAVPVATEYAGSSVASSSFGDVSTSTAMAVDYPGGIREVTVMVRIPSGTHPGIDPGESPTVATLAAGLRPATTAGAVMTGAEGARVHILANGDIQPISVPERIGAGWTMVVSASFVAG